MSHVVVIIQQTILPPPDAQAALTAGEMTAEVKYIPPDSATDAQIGNHVQRIIRRLNKLADD